VRHLLPLLAPLALASPAAAQIYATPTPFCGGRVVAEIFNTDVIPGPSGRATYSTRLYNAGGSLVRAQVQVVGDMLNRYNQQTSINAGQRLTITMGISNAIPGKQYLRGEALAQTLRVSCS